MTDLYNWWTNICPWSKGKKIQGLFVPISTNEEEAVSQCEGRFYKIEL